MKNIVYVALGGAFGSIARYYIGLFFQKYAHNFPYATLLANIVAGFILGFFLEKSLQNNALKLVVLVGFCGGLSTFSTFSNETLQLLMKQQYAYALLNIALSICLCLAAVYAGIFTYQQVHTLP